MNGISDIPQEKTILRREILAKRDSMTGNEVEHKSIEIMKAVLSLPRFKSSKVVLCYAGFRNEVSTAGLMEHCLRSGKRLLLPRIAYGSSGKLMEAVEIHGVPGELQAGAFGILEPVRDLHGEVEMSSIDVVIVPGIAFDFFGNRLGYGKGYYDGFLASLGQDCLKVALAYELQLVHQLPVESHDRKMDLIITEVRRLGDFMDLKR